MIASRNSYLVALISVSFGTLAFSFIGQLFGEIVGNWATSRLLMSFYLAIILAATRISTKSHAIGMKCHLISLVAATCTTGFWLFVSNLNPSTLITFLGYGYDNVGHLMQARIVLGNGGSVLLSGGSGLGPTFMQDSAQIGGSLIASVASLTGTTATDVVGLMAILVSISLAIPIISVIAILAGLATRTHLRSELVLVALVSIAIFGTGYLSRIWFSGYLGSNLGTMCAVLSAVYIATSTSKNIAGISMLVVIMIHTYPLFSLIGVVLLLSSVSLTVMSFRKLPNSFSDLFPIRITMVMLIFGLLLLLPYHATSRSYGASQFLTDGGIESIPASFFIFLLAFYLVPLAVMILIFARQIPFIISLMLYVIAAFGIAAYSLSHVHKLAYYPTKFVITLVLMVVGLVIATLSQVEIRWVRNVFLGILVCLGSTYLLFQPKSEVFLTAFMGEAPTVLESAREAKLEVVDSKTVVELSNLSRQIAMPVLYISKVHESELNTRWVNTLSLNWNDQSWTDWMRLRNLISEEKYVDLGKKEVGNSVVIVTDDINVYRQIKNNYLGTVCLRSLSLNCNKL